MRARFVWSLVLFASSPAMSAFLSASSSRFFPPICTPYYVYSSFPVFTCILLCIDLLNLFLNYLNLSYSNISV